MPLDNFNYSVSIDCVIFGYDTTDLKVLLIKRGEAPYLNYWALPGDLIKEKENIDDAVSRVLKDLTGLSNVYMDQVKTFGDVGRHPLGRVFTVAYFSLLKIEDYQLNPSSFAMEAKWHSVKRVGELAFDHKKIFATCKQELVNSVKVKPIGFELLPEAFTLTELQNLYETIFQTTFDTRNFRKKIHSVGLLTETGELQKSVSHRPAKLYRFDKANYKKLIKSGYNFEI